MGLAGQVSQLLIWSLIPQTGDRSCSSPGKPGSGTADETPWRGSCGRRVREERAAVRHGRGQPPSPGPGRDGSARARLPGSGGPGPGRGRGLQPREARARGAPRAGSPGTAPPIRQLPGEGELFPAFSPGRPPRSSPPRPAPEGDSRWRFQAPFSSGRQQQESGVGAASPREARGAPSGGQRPRGSNSPRACVCVRVCTCPPDCGGPSPGLQEQTARASLVIIL